MPKPSRRQFIQTSTTAAAAGSVALTMPGALSSGVHAHGSDVIKIGLIGCGGRGSGAAVQMLRADPKAKLVAVADVFADHVERRLKGISEAGGDRVDVKPEHQFLGFDAYEKLLATDVDVVILATPPHFRPMHFEAAVKAGKHVFSEKPVAVDAPGVRQTIRAARKAREQNLSVVSGLCWRYHHGLVATMDRVLDGAIGEVVSVQSNYLAGGLWKIDRTPEMSDMEWQLRNWLYFTWVSGDHILEQHVHSLDKMLWAMQAPPVAVVASGGRQVRTGDEYGHVYDHFNTIFEFPGGRRGYSACRQLRGCHNDVSDLVLGTEGQANLIGGEIHGTYSRWKYDKQSPPMHQEEQTVFLRSLREGNRIDNSDYMIESTMMGLMGRMAAYTGQRITWEQALKSEEKLGPDRYDWDVALEIPPVARPGITKFV